MLALEAVELSKTFTYYKSALHRVKSKKEVVAALKDVSLEINEGETLGLLGPNGAGKTTFINIISTLISPDSGSAKIFGFDVVQQVDEVKKIISLSSAYSGFHDEITVKENLEIFAMHYGIEANIKELLNMVDLQEYENTYFSDLSSGNRQKVAIAKTLMVNPRLMLLDELTVALDPNIALKIRRLLKSWKHKHKTTMLLATHNMIEAEEMCDRIAIIHKGNVIANDTPANLKKIIKDEDVIEIKFLDNKSPAFLHKIEGVKKVGYGNKVVDVFVDDAEKRLQKIIQELLAKNFHITSIKIKEPSLEDVFIKLTGERLE